MARAAKEPVIAASAIKLIITASTDQRVATFAAIERVVALTAQDAVIAVAGIDRIIALTGQDEIAVARPIDCIVRAIANEDGHSAPPLPAGRGDASNAEACRWLFLLCEAESKKASFRRPAPKQDGCSDTPSHSSRPQSANSFSPRIRVSVIGQRQPIISPWTGVSIFVGFLCHETAEQPSIINR